MSKRKGTSNPTSARARKTSRSVGSPRTRPERISASPTEPAGARRSNDLSKRLTRAERTALSDARMIKAAVQLIHERGTTNTTLKEVGELAGYSRGLASSRFGSKDALFFALFDQFNRRWKEGSATAVGSRTGLEAFRSANRGLIEFFKTEGKFIRVMYLVAYETICSSDLMREQLAGQHEAYRRGVARWISDASALGEVRKAVSPQRVAVQYVAAVFGIIYQWLVTPEAIDCGQALDDLRENTLKCIET